jgi:tRNA G10  N-methylase Trm11
VKDAKHLSDNDKKTRFMISLAYGRLSSLEIASALESGSFDIKILDTSDLITLIECDLKTAMAFIRRLGGSYKIAEVCGKTIEELVDGMSLPDESKFSWTVSGYDCDPELLEETKISVQSFLKSKSLGKSRFLAPNVETDEYLEASQPGAQRTRVTINELKIKELYEDILYPSGRIPAGLDIVVANGVGDTTLFGYTVGASDVLGFEKRDFSRSYQDPTITIGPRLGRVLVDLAMNKPNGTLLDPFCGLGTILQEALMTGRNIVGVDISRNNVNRTRTNLDWVRKNYQASQRLDVKLVRANAMNLRKDNLPRIDGIATEPILLPKFERNPKSSEANECLSDAAGLYESSLRVFGEILEKKSRVAIISPVIIDDRGREHKLDLSKMFRDLGYKQYSPTAPGLRPENPIRVPTTKRKIIQRDVYVMTVD